MCQFYSYKIKVVFFYCLLCSALLFSTSVVNADFSRVLEFELMSECVGNFGDRYKKGAKIKICSCALEDTINGRTLFVFEKYSDDKDYVENSHEFKNDLTKNINYYLNNFSQCSEIR